MRGDGFLAIWSDVPAPQETDYLHWLTREHMHERLGVPGFLAARLWRAQAVDFLRVLILYELEGPAVLGSAAYLARLNDPTPWSSRIMPILGNFARGGGRRVASGGGGPAGIGRGGMVAAWRFDDAVPPGAAALAAKLAAADRIASAHLLETDRAQTAIPTKEKGMRANDTSFAGLLLAEGLDEPALRAAASGVLPMEPAYYAPLFALEVRR